MHKRHTLQSKKLYILFKQIQRNSAPSCTRHNYVYLYLTEFQSQNLFSF